MELWLWRMVIMTMVLCVNVLNKQTSPVASADIRVLVFVSGCDNLDFEGPTDIISNYSPYALQGETLDLASTSEFNMNDVPNDPNHINLIYHGEKIVSLRTLLGRANYVMSMSPTDFYSGYFGIYYLFGRMPLYPGYDPNGIHSALSTLSPPANAPYNYCTYSALNWVSQCFLGYRGSVIWHCNLGGNVGSGNLMLKRSNREVLASSSYVRATGLNLSSENQSAYEHLRGTGSTASGATVTNQRTQTALTFLAPFYSRFKWIPNAVLSRTLGNSKYDTDRDAILGYATYQGSATDNGARAPLHMYCAAGTDYDPVFFLNVPALYYYPALPAPAP